MPKFDPPAPPFPPPGPPGPVGGVPNAPPGPPGPGPLGLFGSFGPGPFGLLGSSPGGSGAGPRLQLMASFTAPSALDVEPSPLVTGILFINRPAMPGMLEALITAWVISVSDDQLRSVITVSISPVPHRAP
ncbi:hypothetical protein FKQ52_06835 [Brevundimonas sp. M20]|nr:hypothetical protein FKQ52_06835 [Brevundimonas sp. M20]